MTYEGTVRACDPGLRPQTRRPSERNFSTHQGHSRGVAFAGIWNIFRVRIRIALSSLIQFIVPLGDFVFIV